jgi:hypothetical protein
MTLGRVCSALYGALSPLSLVKAVVLRPLGSMGLLA